jgi:hypothetical protein
MSFVGLARLLHAKGLFLKEKYMNHKHADLDVAWEDYASKVIPDNAGSTQVEETRRAFYAGAAVVTGFMMSWTELSLDTKDGAAAMKSLVSQIEVFITSVPLGTEELCEDCKKGLH